MNGRKAKAIRKRGRELLVEWLHSVIPGEDRNKINVDNLEEFLSPQTHIFANRKLLLSAFSLKWVYKKLKRDPDLTLDDLENSLQRKDL